MAVLSTPISCELVLVMDNGVGASGQALYVSRAIKDVKPDALDQDVHQVASVLLDLQSRTNMAIHRRSFNELTKRNRGTVRPPVPAPCSQLLFVLVISITSLIGRDGPLAVNHQGPVHKPLIVIIYLLNSGQYATHIFKYFL